MKHRYFLSTNKKRLAIMQNNASLEIDNKTAVISGGIYMEPENIATEILQDDDEEDIFYAIIRHFKTCIFCVPYAKTKGFVFLTMCVS